MGYYVYETLRKNLERDSGAYAPDVLGLFDAYIKTSADLVTIDNESVEREALEELAERFKSFREVVPANICKSRLVSELIREVTSLIEEY